MNMLGLYIDVSNLYYCIYNNSRGKLNYQKLIDFLSPLGTFAVKKAYGAQAENEAENFIKILNDLGIETFYKTPKYFGAKHQGKADWDVGITIDVIKDLDKLDTVILATADGDMAPLVKYCIEKDKMVIIIGSNISKELKDTATKTIELPPSLVNMFGESK